MGKSQRTKGAAGEREAAALVNDWLGVEIRRNLEQVREGGNDLTLQVQDGATRYKIEVKRQERLQPEAWFAQASAACKNPGDVPVVMYRKNRGDWNVILRAADWLALVREVM